MSELALGGPNKDEEPLTVLLQWLPPVPRCWREGWRDFHAKQEPGQPVVLRAGWRLVGVAMCVFGDTRVLRRGCYDKSSVQLEVWHRVSAARRDVPEPPQGIAQHPGDANMLIALFYTSSSFIQTRWVFITFGRSSTGRRQPKKLITYELWGLPLFSFHIFIAEVIHLTHIDKWDVFL